ncbi:het domain protein [Colletotrichum plurivorum]|uniref:Het domain protein n=1 Tax=Colletotrichum plurivorum TaxID=2175906 RepID=A0A8H6NIF7_9PEZI|nr:het domain protein [Colletotrichum plurivorum]
MWLIDTTSLALTDVYGDPKEDYAILSHTWGCDEVTLASFRDLQKPPPPALDDVAARQQVLATQGYGKIEKAAQIAQDDGLRFLWVDTCCIDKTSSAELSESINSMHRWYRNAKYCIAYLSDVDPVAAADYSVEGSSFRRSRWFTRGWTLQELVAPAVVRFYAGDWSYIKAKEPSHDSRTFCTLLADITSIDQNVLLGTTMPGDISVANRMRWAAHRETTRPEDIAYCLLGLFNVNMPLLYGEGERAFIRLQEEILKETDDQSLFCWALPYENKADPDALHGLLASSPRLFFNIDFEHVRPLPPSRTRESAAVSITNHGLRISMMLVPCDSRDDAYYALLDCVVGRLYEEVPDWWSPCIILRRLWGDQFARVASPDEASRHIPNEQPASVDGSLRLFPVVDANSDHFFDEDKHGTYQTVYVRQTPFDALPEVTVRKGPSRDFTGHCMMCEAYSVVNAWPPERWDAALSVVRTKSPRSGATIVALRFASEEDSDRSFVDVTIGLRRVGRRWEVCHETHSYAGPGSQVQTVYNQYPWIAAAASQATSRSGPQVLEPVAIINTETERRGRRFIQIEVLGACNRNTMVRTSLHVSSNVAMRDLPAAREKLQELSDRIGETSRQPSFEETFSQGINAAASISFPGVRTSYSRDIAVLMDRQFDNVTIPEDKPYSGLVKAIKAGDFAAVHLATATNRSLVEATIDELDGCRVIHCAASLGFMGAVRWLVQLGADVRAYTKSGLMALHLAVLRGRFDIACELAAAAPPVVDDAPVVEDDTSVAGDALVADDTPSAKDAPWKRFLTVEQESVLHLLAAHGRSGWVDDMVAKKLSALLGLDAPEALAHVNSRGELALHRAAANAGAGNSFNWPGSIQVHPLQPLSASLEEKDREGRSVLFHAACGGNAETVRRLIRFGASPDSTDEEGRTPLHAAAAAGHSEAVRALIDLGADPDKGAGIDGLTPLHLACLYGHERCMGELLKPAELLKQTATKKVVVKADVDKSTTGHIHVFFKPIHVAVGNGRAGCVAKLLKAGCDVFGHCDGYVRLGRSREGGWEDGQLVVLETPLTALDVAMVLGHTEISSMIEAKASKGATDFACFQMVEWGKWITRKRKFGEISHDTK